MRDDLDLERVISDPDYRRKAIEVLNRAEERPQDGTAQIGRGNTVSARDAQNDAD